MEYLGFILSPNGLQMDPSKVSAIMEWLELQKVKDVQVFLGSHNFYQRFIHGYAEITLPLTKLCKKNAPWHRGKGFHDKILYSDKKPDEVISQNRIMVDRIFENFQRILSLNGP